MVRPNSWPELPVRLAVDASVVINLIGSGKSAEILRALNCEAFVVEEVARELSTGAPNGRDDAQQLDLLHELGLVQKATLATAGLELFEQLTIGPASVTLDDGEAATIAIAYEHNLVAVIDENKGRRLCLEHAGGVELLSSVDLFLHQNVAKSLGADHVDSVFHAMTAARMHVRPEHRDLVIELLGQERAAQCTSLPGTAEFKG